jgi:hypothetical protein
MQAAIVHKIHMFTYFLTSVLIQLALWARAKSSVDVNIHFSSCFPGENIVYSKAGFRRTLAFQKPLAFLSEIINCFTNIFDSKRLKYSPKVYIFALRRENGNSRRNEPLFLVSVDKLLPTCLSTLLFN